MWQAAKRADGTVIAAQFPIVAGTLPSGLVLNANDTGGEEKHSLTVEELAPHVHTKSLFLGDFTRGGDDPTAYEIQDPDAGEQKDQVGTTLTTDSTGGTGTPPVVAPHNNLPNYVVGYLLQRTQRLFYSIS